MKRKNDECGMIKNAVKVLFFIGCIVGIIYLIYSTANYIQHHISNEEKLLSEQGEKIGELQNITMELLTKEHGYVNCESFNPFNDTDICTEIKQINKWCKCEKWEKYVDVAKELVGSDLFYREVVFQKLFAEWLKMGHPCLAWYCELDSNGLNWCKCIEWGG